MIESWIMSAISSKDKKKQFVHNMIIAVAGTCDIHKLSDYFTDDIEWQVNDLALDGLEQVKRRINWMKNNLSKREITIVKIIVEDNMVASIHLNHFATADGKKHIGKIFTSLTFRDNKICRFEAVAIVLNKKEKDLVTSIETNETGDS